MVLMKLNRVDGSGSSSNLVDLSTHDLFLRFSKDFRREEGFSLNYEIVDRNGEEFFRLRYEEAAEFLLTKDYRDNWESEMHERFCFWSYSDWVKALKEAGFEVDGRSSVFTNPWIEENRFEGKAELFTEFGEPLEYPPTNCILIARKKI